MEMMFCKVEDVKKLFQCELFWTDEMIAERIKEISNTDISLRLAGHYDLPLKYDSVILNRICSLLVAHEMLMDEYGVQGGEYYYLQREADYLLDGIEHKKIRLNKDIG